ncbi:MAG: hypothetical protein AB7V16_12655 [Vulcanibacillus sp.]
MAGVLGSRFCFYFCHYTGTSQYEETMHAFQDNFYKGLSKYGPGKAGYTNMEFEAKLMQAIYCVENGIIQEAILNGCFKGGNWTEFQGWLLDYLSSGITNDFWEEYNKFIEIFANKYSTYSSHISDSFPRMSEIENLMNGCK